MLAYMDGSRRIISKIELCDIVKDNTLSLHASWTSHFDIGVTIVDELEVLISSRGVYLEDRILASQLENNPGPAAFAANIVDDRIRLFTD